MVCINIRHVGCICCASPSLLHPSSASYLSPMSADVNIHLLPTSPHTRLKLFFGGVFLVVAHLVLEKVVIVVDVVQLGDDGAGTRSVGWHCWHCPLIFLAAGKPCCCTSLLLLLSILCTLCSLQHHAALPSLPWRNNMGEGN